MTIDLIEKYVPRKMLLELGGFTTTDLSTFLKENNIQQTEDGYPVFAIMSALNHSRKKGRFGKATELDEQLKIEKIEGQRIMNALKMKKLIEREAAINRIRTTLQALAQKIKYGAILAAPRLPMMTNVRDIENIILESWESAADSLLEEAESIVEWEKYEVHIQSRRERMDQSTEESLSFGDSEEDSSTFKE